MSGASEIIAMTEGLFALWDGRAKRLVEQALAEWESEEQHATLSAALACLRIADGDLPPDDLDGYPFPGEPEDLSGCICPPEMLARGGFKGRCPVHGNG
jgi:hypothetical protein